MTRATGKPYRHVIEILADLVPAAPMIRAPMTELPQESIQ